jgi:hypothetical protein
MRGLRGYLFFVVVVAAVSVGLGLLFDGLNRYVSVGIAVAVATTLWTLLEFRSSG